MIDFASLLPSKQLLNIVGISTGQGYTKRNGHSHNIIYSPLTVLSFIKLSEADNDFHSTVKHMHDIFAQTKYNYGEDVVFDVWLKMLGFQDESSFLNFMHQENPDLVIGSNFADLANYVFLTGRKQFTSMDVDEWIIANENLDIHKQQTPFNNLKGKDAFSHALNIMSSNYSISEALNIMFMVYESQYDLFLKQKIGISEYLDSKVINSTVYQMLIIYYYNVVKEARRADPENSLRLQEYITYEGRQKFYEFVYGYTFAGNKELYLNLEHFNALDLYDKLDNNIVNRVHLLMNSEISIEQWHEYSDVPYFWLKSLIDERKL